MVSLRGKAQRNQFLNTNKASIKYAVYVFSIKTKTIVQQAKNTHRNIMQQLQRIRYTFRSAFRALSVNRVRSALTVLGVVIGVTAIMLIVALGDGAQRLILGEIEGMGADTITVRPGRNPEGPSDFAQTLFSDALKDRELAALQRKENVPELIDIAPVVMVSQTVSYGGATERPTIYGWSADFLMRMLGVGLLRGEAFDAEDIRGEASVAIIGPELATNLFGDEDPIGKSLRIKGHNFRVIGIFNPESGSAFFKVDKLVLVPYTTAQTYLSGKDYFQEIIIKVRSRDVVDRSVADITATLRELHNISDPAKDDFYVETQQGTMKQVGTILNSLTAFLAAVVAISLVVGGIGVMNVMLVSVTERTREIGLRKALGARNSDILRQFLIESVVLTLLGGVIGIIFGVLLGVIIAQVLSSVLSVDWVYAFPLGATLIGVGVSIIVGLIFGIYPAYKASRKSPIEALRWE